MDAKAIVWALVPKAGSFKLLHFPVPAPSARVGLSHPYRDTEAFGCGGFQGD